MKFVVPVLLVIIALGIYFLTHPASKTDKAGADYDQAFSNPSGVGLRIETNSVRMKRTKVELGSNSNIKPEEIDQQIERIIEASAKADPASFQLITTALKDARPEIRKAALEATIQFGSRDAIPILKEIAATTEDVREKVEILDAIEFLELPSLSEIKRPRRTNSNPARVEGSPK
ncbi:MAG: HEAT repeat domain-containing protein [Verrucomicrobiota bacterium]